MGEDEHIHVIDVDYHIQNIDDNVTDTRLGRCLLISRHISVFPMANMAQHCEKHLNPSCGKK